MVLAKEKIKDIVSKYGKNEKDTGSPEVQVVLLSERINALVKHYEKHKKDLLTKRNFLKLIAQRRKLLAYIKNESEERYQEIIKQIGL